MTNHNVIEPFWEASNQKEAGIRFGKMFDSLQGEYHNVHQRWLRQTRAYLDRHIQSLGPGGYSKFDLDGRRGETKVRKNLVRSLVDAMVNQTAGNTSRATFKTTNASPEQRGRARNLEQFINALIFNEMTTTEWDIGRRDALICGPGVWRPQAIPIENGKKKNLRIELKRVMPWTVFVDPLEAYFGAPRTIIQTHLVPRDVAAAQFPKDAPLINDPNQVKMATSPTNTSACNSVGMAHYIADTILIAEVIRLPSQEGAGDGFQAWYLPGITELRRLKWTANFLPHVFVSWNPPGGSHALWSTSLAEEAYATHMEINEVNERDGLQA